MGIQFKQVDNLQETFDSQSGHFDERINQTSGSLDQFASGNAVFAGAKYFTGNVDFSGAQGILIDPDNIYTPNSVVAGAAKIGFEIAVPRNSTPSVEGAFQVTGGTSFFEDIIVVRNRGGVRAIEGLISGATGEFEQVTGVRVNATSGTFQVLAGDSFEMQTGIFTKVSGTEGHFESGFFGDTLAMNADPSSAAGISGGVDIRLPSVGIKSNMKMGSVATFTNFNTTSTNNAILGGGILTMENEANGSLQYSSILGGWLNSIRTLGSNNSDGNTVIGGASNRITNGNYNMVLAGQSNHVSGVSWSLAAGKTAYVTGSQMAQFCYQNGVFVSGDRLEVIGGQVTAPSGYFGAVSGATGLFKEAKIGTGGSYFSNTGNVFTITGDPLTYFRLHNMPSYTQTGSIAAPTGTVFRSGNFLMIV